MRFRLKMQIAAIVAIITGLAGWGGTLIANAEAHGSGPVFAQGAFMYECINTLNENMMYWELRHPAPGNCAAGYEQAVFINDPQLVPLVQPTTVITGNADVVTVTYPGAQTDPVGELIKPITMMASSNQGHTISWSVASSPAGLFGSGELNIDPATGIISGTPEIVGTYGVTVTATDSAGTVGTTTFTWIIT